MTDEDRALKALGARVRALRKSRGLTQSELAHRAGLYDVGKIERGESNPAFLTLLRIARTLEVALADLFVLRDPKDVQEEEGLRLDELTRDQPPVVRDAIYTLLRALRE